MQIKKDLIPLWHPNRKGTKIKPVAICVHYTANYNPKASDEMHVKYVGRPYKTINGKIYEADGKTPFRFGSAQWFIDRDSATLVIPQDEVSWACGDRQLPYDNGCKGQTKIARDVFGHKQNYMTINYELCVNDDWNKTCDNAIEIIVADMIKYDIPISKVYRHHDITSKNCPKPFVENPKAWEDFKKKIENKLVKEVFAVMFQDMNKVSPWAKESVIRVAEKGIINGNEKGEFMPQENVTREQLAVVLDKLLKLLGK